MTKDKIRKSQTKELIWVKEVMIRFPEKVADYRAGKNKSEIMEFLKSCAYLLSFGKANPKAIELILLIELETKGIRKYNSAMIKVEKWNRNKIMILKGSSNRAKEKTENKLNSLLPSE